jgi:hypothetical protein
MHQRVSLCHLRTSPTELIMNLLLHLKCSCIFYALKLKQKRKQKTDGWFMSSKQTKYFLHNCFYFVFFMTFLYSFILCLGLHF